MKNKTLGIIGGMGPLATAYFFNKIVELTPADCDQEHIPAVIINDVLVPDRTQYILDNTKPCPLPRLLEDIKKLESIGAECIAIPCNTTHFFLEEMQKKTSLPIISILDATLSAVCADGKSHRTALLATTGSIKSGIYVRAAEKYTTEIYVPEKEICDKVTAMIYDQVKMGKPCEADKFYGVIDEMLAKGCDSVILGCTELSVIYGQTGIRKDYIFDSTELLAKACVKYCTE